MAASRIFCRRRAIAAVERGRFVGDGETLVESVTIDSLT